MKQSQAHIESWRVLIRKSFQQRVSADKFERVVKLMSKEGSVAGEQLCDILMQSRSPSKHGTDPLLSLFTERLLLHKLLSLHDILQSLYEQRHKLEPSALKDGAVRSTTKSILEHAELEQVIFSCLVRVLSSSTYIGNSTNAKLALPSLGTWMTYLTEQNANMLIQSASTSTPDVTSAIFGVRENFAAVLVLLLPKLKAGEDDVGLSKDTIKSLSSSLSAYIPIIAVSHLSLATRLHTIQKEILSVQRGLAVNGATERNNNAKFDAIDLDLVTDISPFNSRASFYIYLGALLSGRPTASDHAILSFLQSRYPGDSATAAIDLMIATFDVVASSSDSPTSSSIPRAFLIGKVPIILNMLSAMNFVPTNSGLLISQALSHLDQSKFPASSHGLDPDTDSMRAWTLRADFVSACALHGLINENSIEGVLGERPAQSASVRWRVNRQTLVDQCKGDEIKLHNLILELELVDGNAVAKTEALVEIFHAACTAKNKPTLKQLSRHISENPACLNAIALYSNILEVVQPLCRMLVDWKHDEDQGEMQPAYDEFSACLLLVLSISHRFNLTSTELGLAADDTFLRRLTEPRSETYPTSTLSPDQDRHISGWITGLFETEGISDELMSSCSPQEFYDLVPTIFQQIVMACHVNALDLKSLKSGMELLLEPFLLPALIPGIRWLTQQLSKSRKDKSVIVPILRHLTRFGTSIDDETQRAHYRIMQMVGPDAAATLQHILQHSQSDTDVESLLSHISTYYSNSEESTSTTCASLRSWTLNQRGSMLASFRTSFGALCYWTSHGTMNAAMPNFRYEHLQAVVQLFGSKQILDAIVGEIIVQTATGLGDVALDIGTAMIYNSSSPASVVALSGAQATATPIKGRLTLLDALQIAMQDPLRLTTEDTLKAETIVRLNRRTTNLASAIAAAGETIMPMPMPTTEDIINNMDLEPAMGIGGGLADNALDFGNAGAGDLQLQDIDTSMLETKDNDRAASAAAVDAANAFGTVTGDSHFTNAEDDIFGDLDLDMEFS